MADFQTHITTSTVLGIAGGLAAHAFYEVPLPSCILAGGLCGVAGMLPDLDSDSGVPLRESVAFAAAIIPMMLLERFAKWGLGFEATVLISAILYLVVRFGFAEFLKNYTVHRGMFHSIPAALISAELTFLIFDNENVALRFLNAGAVFTGFMSHLILDELWSVDVNWGLVRFKSSFGSALKFWGDNAWANFATYGKLALLTLLMTRDAAWSNVVEPWMTGRPAVAQGKTWTEQLANYRLRYFQNVYGGIPPSAIEHPLNPLHPQPPFSDTNAPFAQQYPNYYPNQAIDPLRPLTGGIQYQASPQSYSLPQASNPPLPFTNPQQRNTARLPDLYQSHAPAAQPSQYPGTSSPYQQHQAPPSRPSMNPQNWQLQPSNPQSNPTTNSLQYQSSTNPDSNPWTATNWNGSANFTHLGSRLTPNAQHGLSYASHGNAGYDPLPNYNNANNDQSPSSLWNPAPYGSAQMPYNSGIQNHSNALDRFPSLQR